MITLSPAVEGAIRGALTAVVFALVAYFADPTHLTFVSGGTATLVSAILLAAEGSIKGSGSGGLFGASAPK